MKCCSACFRSGELKYFIESRQHQSTCDLCGRNHVFCVDSRELIYSLTPILDLYESSDNGRSLASRLLSDFPDSIFVNLSEEQVETLLRGVFADDQELIAKYVDQHVVLACEEDDDRKAEIAELVTTWEMFCSEIKFNNRFHVTNSLNLKRLGALLSVMERSIPAGRIFYRARIGGGEGFRKDEMGQPPALKVQGGRANPQGISYLYLASDELTVIHEVRAGLFDYVTVGEFQLKEETSIIDLVDVVKRDPFAFVQTEEGSSALESFIAFRPFLTRLGEELSRPLRSSDSDLDYIPTQYLTEFIKSQGYSGVMYGSSQRPGGQNFAIFDHRKFDCVRVQLNEVNRLDLTTRLIENSGAE
jgi:RES domain